jgi:hypothetical protein
MLSYSYLHLIKSSAVLVADPGLPRFQNVAENGTCFLFIYLFN